MSISNSDDTIDVRDVIARFEELEEERFALSEALKEAQTAYDDATASEEESEEALLLRESRDGASSDLQSWDDGDEGQELNTLKTLLEELCGRGGDHQWQGDWYPTSLIRDSYFEEAMDEMLEDIGAMPKDVPSYLTITVDYDALQTDYSSVEFDGVTYWYR